MSRTGDFTSEADLCAALVRLLRADGWRTWQEVPLHGGGRCDVVAARSGLVWVFETKMSASVSLLLQGLDRLHGAGAHGVVLAVPRHPWGFQDLCSRIGVGLAVVNPRDLVMKTWPAFARKARTADLLARCSDEAEEQDGGTAGGGYWTPFKSAVRDFDAAFKATKRTEMPVREAASLPPIVAYKQTQEVAALRRWLVWTLEAGLIPGYEIAGAGKARVVRRVVTSRSISGPAAS